MKKTSSITSKGSVLGPTKTQNIPKGTLPNPTRPADTFRKTPPASWGKRIPKK